MTLNFFVVLPYIWDQSTLESFSEIEEPLFSKATLKNLNIPQKLRKLCLGRNFLIPQRVLDNFSVKFDMWYPDKLDQKVLCSRTCYF